MKWACQYLLYTTTGSPTLAWIISISLYINYWPHFHWLWIRKNWGYCGHVISIGNSMICSRIFGINTTSDISKLLYVLRQFWNITSGIYAKYHVQIMLLFVYTTTRKRFVIFTCRYFKLSWNTTALKPIKLQKFLM